MTNHPKSPARQDGEVQPVILGDDALAEIEAHWISGSSSDEEDDENIGALCQTVRAAWAESQSLRDELADAKQLARNMETERNTESQRANEWRETNTALREQLAELADFASHADDCEWWGSIPRTTCSCGLADILENRS